MDHQALKEQTRTIMKNQSDLFFVRSRIKTLKKQLKKARTEEQRNALRDQLRLLQDRKADLKAALGY